MLVSDSSKTMWCDIGATHVDRQQGREAGIRCVRTTAQYSRGKLSFKAGYSIRLLAEAVIRAPDAVE
jgi:hypothetical protein